jgi:hypothetical protein
MSNKHNKSFMQQFNRRHGADWRGSSQYGRNGRKTGK